MFNQGQGGNSLGTASGRILIDVSNVEQAAQTVRQAAAQMTAAFTNVTQASRNAARAMSGIYTGARQAAAGMNAVGNAAQRTATNVNTATQSSIKFGQAAQTAASVSQASAAKVASSMAIVAQSASTAAMRMGMVGAAAGGANAATAQFAAIQAAADGASAALGRLNSQIQQVQASSGRFALPSGAQDWVEGEFSVVGTMLPEGAAAQAGQAAQQVADAVTGPLDNMRIRLRSLNVDFINFGKTLQRVAGIIFPFSVAAGILSLQGIRAANSIEAMEIRFRALEGSSQAAQARIAGLTEEARKFNLPLTEVLAGIARLQPLLKQTGNETNRFVSLVARLATINPIQGAEGAAIAIGEALSGTGNDFYSLQERFNIPRNLIRQAIAETDNFADALDHVLNQLGATEQTAMEFGQTFQGTWRRAKDEVFRFIGEGLRPILRGITPLIQAAANFAAWLGQTSPIVASLVGGIMLVTAAMAPLLYAVGKLSELWGTVGMKIRLAGIAQSRAARLTGAGIAAYAGLEIGQTLYGAVTGESRQSMSDRLNEFIAQSLSLILAALEQVANILVVPFTTLRNVVEAAASALRYFLAAAQKSAAELQMAFTADPARRAELDASMERASGAMLREFLAQGSGSLMSEDIAGRLVQTRETVDPNFAMTAAMKALTGDFSSISGMLGLTPVQSVDAAQSFRELTASGADAFTALNQVLDNLDVPSLIGYKPVLDLPNFNERIMQFYNNVTGGMGFFSPRQDTGAAEGTTAQGFSADQIAAYEQFKQDMADMERDYNEDVLRETQDFQRRRNDIILEYNERVVELQEDELRRRVEAEEDLAREIADVQADTAKQQADAQRDLQDEIAKILRESRIRVLEAAAQLDARAVFEEQRRTKARIDELSADFDQETEERKRQADERVQDLRDNFAREEQERAEDFARRMAELERQKNRQLQQLQQQHYDTLASMRTQYQRERDLRNQQFITEFNELGMHNGRVLSIHRQGQFQIEYELLAWYNRMAANLSGGSSGGGGGGRGPTLPTPYATGTSWVPSTSTYQLHAGEGVMTAGVNAVARSMLGGNYTQAQLAGLISGQGGGSSATYDFSGMQVVLGDVGGRSDAQVARMIEDGLYQFFTRAAMRQGAVA